jgi:hypothetical protein
MNDGETLIHGPIIALLSARVVVQKQPGISLDARVLAKTVHLSNIVTGILN